MYLNEPRFWEFMYERETIRLRRRNGEDPSAWSNDPIFQEYSFTNVKRIHDRTSSVLYSEFYNEKDLVHPSRVALLNSAIFRFHGTIETARRIGWNDTWGPEQHDQMVRRNAISLERVFTSAYIVPSCGDSRPKYEVVADIIDGIWERSGDIIHTENWELFCNSMKICWGVGSFMAKEIALDYMLITNWQPDDWGTWTPVGPGARRGAGAVVNGIIKGIPEWEALQVIRELYSRRMDNWPSDYVPLALTDIQFQLCEFAKYEKARTGVGRPKRKFRPTIDTITKR